MKRLKLKKASLKLETQTLNIHFLKSNTDNYFYNVSLVFFFFNVRDFSFKKLLLFWRGGACLRGGAAEK